MAQQGLEISDTGLLPGSAENPAEPNALVSTLALQTIIRSPSFSSKYSPLSENGLHPINPLIVDYELQAFAMPSYAFQSSDNQGNSQVLRTQWSRELPGGRDAWGIRALAQYISLEIPVDQDPVIYENFGYLNFSLGAFWERNLSKSSDRLTSVGAGIDLLGYDQAFADKALLNSPIGGQVSGFARTTKWMGIHKLTGGAMLLQSFGGVFLQGYAGLAGEWVASFHTKVDLKVSGLYKLLLYQHMVGQLQQSDPTTRSNMFLGIGGVYWIKPGIGIDLGYRTTMLVPNLNTHTLLSGVRFSY
jgi:hypothetical protein